MTGAVISFTKAGAALSTEAAAVLAAAGIQCSVSTMKAAAGADVLYVNSLSDWCREHFMKDQVLVFVGACGIAVRGIAPYIKSKGTDPAVLVLDDSRRFVIPLLSGHTGGANRLAQQLAQELGLCPVVTTATDARGLFAVDSWAREHQCRLAEPSLVKEISGTLLDQKTVGFYSDFPVRGTLPDLLEERSSGDLGICISIDPARSPFVKTLHLIPQIISVGIGCRKDVPFEILDEFIGALLAQKQISRLAVGWIGSVSLKKDEEGLNHLCDHFALPLCVYPAAELMALAGEFTASAFVTAVTGTDSVCERAAVMPFQSRGHSYSWICRKTTGNGIAAAAAQKEWEVIFHE